jgi:hypothetical protein
MISIPTLASNQVMIGNAAGWALTLHVENEDREVQPAQAPTLNSARYEARISATLPAGLEAGSYSITIEGMTDDEYKLIAPTKSKEKKEQAKQPTVARLYLYWLDANASPLGYLANLSGLTDTLGQPNLSPSEPSFVAEIAITKVSRAVGARRYETTIEGKERVYQILATRIPNNKPISQPKVKDAVTSIAEDTHVDIKLLGFGTDETMPLLVSDGSGNEQVGIESGHTYAVALDSLAQRMEAATKKYGRGLMLIRNGSLYFGVRKSPLMETDIGPTEPPKPLTLGSGLLQSEMLDDIYADPDNAVDAPKRRQFKLTLKGRPDIKPGDMVAFDPPPEEQTQPDVLNSLLGAFARPILLLPSLGTDTTDHPVNLYVTSVAHTLGRASGFVTTVTGVEITDLWNIWDSSSGKGAHAAGRATGTVGARADGAASAASAIRQTVRQGAETPRGIDVGEVRSFHTSGDGSSEPPGQTELIWRGLVESDGRSNQARRLDIRRDTPAPVEGVAYTSPFAWGKCGLVLPRYPGMRVVLAHRNGQTEDPLDLGALWTSGHGPTSQAGDYWLILPAAVDQGARSQVADSTTPSEYSGKVTNDLIDADGNRIIEVGELTLRVGTDKLGNAGDRPARPSDQSSVTIEHTGGKSSIVMKQDGSVTITGKNITIDAGSGTITMKADSVDVQVQSNMNVH